MKLYKISRNNFKYDQWDTYRAAIVAAPSEKKARNIHPDGDIWGEERNDRYRHWDLSTWADRKYIDVEYIGEAADDEFVGVILSDYNAG